MAIETCEKGEDMALEDLDDKPKRGPGRPRKHPLRGATTTTVTRQEFVEGQEIDDGEDESLAPPLFDKRSIADKSIVKIRVTRTTPDEGHLGYLDDPESQSEQSLFEKWGGSTYRLEGLNSLGQIQKISTRKVAGDPKFVSKAAEISYRRNHGITESMNAAGGDKGMSVMDVLMLMKQMEGDKTKEMEARDAARRAEERDHQTMMRKLELEAAEKARRDDEIRAERARKDDEDRDRRRRADEEERETRRRREQQEQEARQQQFTAQMIQMVQASSQQALQFVKAESAAHVAKPEGSSLMEAMKTVLAIKNAFTGEETGGGEETADPMALMIKHGPDWLNGLGNAIAGTVREVRGGQIQASGSAAPLNLPLPPGSPLSSKVETLVAKLAAKGHNPEAALTALVDNVLKEVDTLPPANAPANAPARPLAAPSGPIPFVQSPVGVAGAAPQAEPATEPPKPRRLARLPFVK